MDFLELAKSRYSCRRFSDVKLEDDKLEKILEAGRIAPTAKNLQPQRIYVAQSEESIAKLNDLSKCIYGASTVLIIGFDKTEAWENPFEEVNQGEVDATIIATHMILEATDLGVKSLWVGLFGPEETRKALNLPETFRPVALMPLGYGTEEDHPSFRHEERYDIDKTVTYI